MFNKWRSQSDQYKKTEFRSKLPSPKVSVSSARNAFRVIPLGGLDEVGRNCVAVEFGNEVLLIDAGLGFPDSFLQPGADLLLPNVSYLKLQNKRVIGIVLTHGHMDHIGALPYLLPALNFPTVYGTLFTVEMVKRKLAMEDEFAQKASGRLIGDEKGVSKKAKFQVVARSESVRIGNFKVSFANVTHSIPDASSILVTTSAGSVFFSGDYKFDREPMNEKPTNFPMLESFGKIRPSLGFLESTNSFEKGWSLSEKQVYSVLRGVVSHARGRVIIATFSSEITRIYSLIDIAYKLKRKVVIWGRSIRDAYDIALKTGYIQSYKDVVIQDKDVKKFADRDLMFIVTGTQAEELSVLSKMVRNEFRLLKLKVGDMVVMSSSVIPGNALPIINMLDKLIDRGINVVHKRQMEVHATGHAHQMELRKMAEMVKPTFVVPGYANAMLRDQHRYLMERWGFPRDRILMINNGDVLEYRAGKWSIAGKISAEPVVIDGKMRAVEDLELYEARTNLMENGLILIKLAGGSNIEVADYGLIPVSLRKSLHDSIKLLSKVILEDKHLQKSDVISRIKSGTEAYIDSSLGKRPIVIVG